MIIYYMFFFVMFYSKIVFYVNKCIVIFFLLYCQSYVEDPYNLYNFICFIFVFVMVDSSLLSRLNFFLLILWDYKNSKSLCKETNLLSFDKLILLLLFLLLLLNTSNFSMVSEVNFSFSCFMYYLVMMYFKFKFYTKFYVLVFMPFLMNLFILSKFYFLYYWVF